VTAATDSCVANEQNTKPLLTLISAPSWDRPNDKPSNDSAKLSTLGLLQIFKKCRGLGAAGNRPVLGGRRILHVRCKGLHRLLFPFRLADGLFEISTDSSILTAM
jgi:hypothetical protein